MGGNDGKGRGGVEKRGGQAGRRIPQGGAQPINGPDDEHEGDGVAKAHSPFVFAEDGRPRDDGPVGHRRFCPMGFIVQTRHKVIAGFAHFTGALGVAALGGLVQATGSLEDQGNHDGQQKRDGKRMFVKRRHVWLCG